MISLTTVATLARSRWVQFGTLALVAGVVIGVQTLRLGWAHREAAVAGQERDAFSRQLRTAVADLRGAEAMNMHLAAMVGYQNDRVDALRKAAEDAARRAQEALAASRARRISEVEAVERDAAPATVASLNAWLEGRP